MRTLDLGNYQLPRGAWRFSISSGYNSDYNWIELSYQEGGPVFAIAITKEHQLAEEVYRATLRNTHDIAEALAHWSDKPIVLTTAKKGRVTRTQTIYPQGPSEVGPQTP